MSCELIAEPPWSNPKSSSMMTFFVVRDDLFPGGIRPAFFRYYSRVPTKLSMQAPAEGGAQTALATVAAKLGKRATIFVAERRKKHERTLMAQRLGAQIVQVSPVISMLFRHVRASTASGRARFWHRSVDMRGRTSYCSGGALHRGTARRSVVCGCLRRLGARCS